MAAHVPAAFEALLDHARGAASAYHAALSDDMPEQDARWLRQGADEHQQTVRLLTPHIESLLAKPHPTWLTAGWEAGKTKVAKLLGHGQVLAVLMDAEQKLIDSLASLTRQQSLPVELKALCEDQEACAKTRLSHLRQRQQAEQRAQATERTDGPLGHRAVQVNTTKPAASENSDC